MAHQELAAEIMAMRLAADEAEEKRIERKYWSISVGLLTIGVCTTLGGMAVDFLT